MSKLTEQENYELASKLRSEVEMVRASIDVLVMQQIDRARILNGIEIIRDSDTYTITFDSLPSSDYSIHIVTQEFVQKWYESKSQGGIIIRFERPYTGLLFWTIIYEVTDE